MFFKSGPGAYFLVDGQYGSTGKGLLADYLSDTEGHMVDAVTSNAGPNSGHTSYHGDEKVVLKQLPTLAVMEKLRNPDTGDIPIYLSAGAIINPLILNAEVEKYGVQVFLDGSATVITDGDVIMEGSGSIQQVAGTRQGVGAALARKVLRDPSAVARSYPPETWHPNIQVVEGYQLDASKATVFMEISQGFSLGLNSRFYPKVTSRECTVAQGCADARIAPQLVKGVAMVIRTYPIRVANHEGFSSGGHYEDQQEINWSDIGIEPELTTVTKRPRRIFTFSRRQYIDALIANRPTLVFCNFMNYLPEEVQELWKEGVRQDAFKALGYNPDFLWGYGPKVSDVRAD